MAVVDRRKFVLVAPVRRRGGARARAQAQPARCRRGRGEGRSCSPAEGPGEARSSMWCVAPRRRAGGAGCAGGIADAASAAGAGSDADKRSSPRCVVDRSGQGSWRRSRPSGPSPPPLPRGPRPRLAFAGPDKRRNDRMPQFSSPRSALAAAFKLARLAAATAILALGGQAHAKEFHQPLAAARN